MAAGLYEILAPPFTHGTDKIIHRLVLGPAAPHSVQTLNRFDALTLSQHARIHALPEIKLHRHGGQVTFQFRQGK
jgi:hypothetical protein